MTKKRVVLLSATELAIAKRMGLTPQEYAQQRAVLENTGEEDEYENFDNPNKMEIMNVPIKTLRDLWLAKFGNNWTLTDSLDDEWDKIYTRLSQYNLMESYDGEYWTKLKDEL